MSHVLDVLLLILGLLVGLWILLFGLLGLALGESAGLARSTGVLVGIALGPIGVGWMIWRFRRYVPTPGDLTASPPDVNEGSSGLFF